MHWSADPSEAGYKKHGLIGLMVAHQAPANRPLVPAPKVVVLTHTLTCCARASWRVNNGFRGAKRGHPRTTGKHVARGATFPERGRQHQLNDRRADVDVDWNLFALLACLDCEDGVRSRAKKFLFVLNDLACFD